MAEASTPTTHGAAPGNPAREAERKAAAPKPPRKNFPSRSDKEAYAAWLKELEAPDRSNCRA